MGVHRTLADLTQNQPVPTIDLGDISALELEPSPPPVSRASRRGLVLTVLVLLIAFASSASGRGTGYLGNPLWTARTSLAGFALGSTSVILSEPGGTAIVGRDLATGRASWTMMLASPPQSFSELANGFAAVEVRDIATQATTTLLITDSGTVLARIPGTKVVSIAVGPYLLVASRLDTVAFDCAGDDHTCTHVSTFDIGSGRRVWRLPLTGDLIPSVADPSTGIRRVATMRSDGMVEIHDPATGSTVRSYPLPGGRHSGHGDGGYWPQALLVGDTLIVAVRRDLRAELMAYPLGPEGYAWTASMPVSPPLTATTAQFYVTGCGRMLCLHAEGADAVFAPETGALHGQLGAQVVGQFGDFLLAVPSTERPGTTLSRRTVLVLSAADGRQLATLPDTAVVSWRDAGSRAMLAHQGPRGTDITILDGAGGYRLLGTVSGSDLTCAAASGLLVCTDPSGLVRAWRLP
jgi:hypothetical protein